MGVAMGGAPHASELPYVFDQSDLRPDALDTGKDAEVAALTHRYWVNFAKTGKPDGDGTVPAWPSVTPDDDQVQVIGTNGTANMTDPRKASVDFVARRAEGK